MADKKHEVKFEDAVKKLEEIVNNLESKDIPLEDSIKLFEEGMKLASFCNKRLDEAERRINVVMKGKDGKLVEEGFNPGDEKE